ncbi:MAG: hypothetical protein PHW64_06505 [Sulfuricurvum sp.]|nr:hypothetical protein [Sulfuricurvum sp.]
MIRLVPIILILFSLLRGEDSTLLNAHIRIIPKIMALYPTAKYIPSATLAIVYEGNRKVFAQQIASQINSLYNGKIGEVYFKAIPLSTNEVLNSKSVTFIYFVQMSSKTVEEITEWGTDNGIPTFSYDMSDLNRGALGSVSIERNTMIYLNKNVLKNGKFHFNESLYSIARLVE